MTFAADFDDITIIQKDTEPSNCDPKTCSNRGAAITDDNGQAHVTVIAGLTTGLTRIIAAAPPALNISTGVTVNITGQGFISLGTLSIVPSAVTFVNPALGPDDPGSPPTIAVFQALGGAPPDRWDRGNQDLGSIAATDIPNVNETAEYTLTGAISTAIAPTALQDTVTLYDADRSKASATVNVVFADCTLMADQSTVTLPNVPGNNFRLDVSDGVPPFAVTQLFPDTATASAINVLAQVIDANGNVISGETCDATGKRCVITFTLPTDFRTVIPGTMLIRDVRDCKATIQLTIQTVRERSH